MKKILLLFLILPLWASAQVIDDFADGDFTANPSWIGTDTCFIVNNSLQLQSSANTAGEAWLSTIIVSEATQSTVDECGFPSSAEDGNDEMEWRFWIRESFSPSANNYAEVWLCADTSELPLSTQGYFLRFGSAGSQDAIELYRKDPTEEHLVCKGTDAAIASSFKVAVQVKRNSQGNWTLATDYDNLGNYAMEAEGFDDTYPVEGYFGFYIKYTASNARKFYFDDVYIGPEIIDTEPPELLSLEVVDAQHLLLTFNESLAETALDPLHYVVLHHYLPLVGEPSGCEERSDEAIQPEQSKLGQVGLLCFSRNDIPDTVRFDGNPSKVFLGFKEPFPENSNLQLKVTGISDLSGNVMPETSWDFAVYQPAENDVVINEIMADPSPVVGLPEWEYVELFNTTSFTIDLKDWTFFIGNTAKTLPFVQIEPLGYLILCKDDAVPELCAFGPVCGFSSFTIANAGATLRLFSSDETLVSEVSFNDNWYHDAEKRNGGWSLEQIDPFNPCAGTVNWSASIEVSGGTPGCENSINAPNATIPQVARVSMLGDNIVMLWFDQQMNRQSLMDPSQYLVEEFDLYPVEVVCNPVENSSLELLFDYHFWEGVIYTLVLNGMESCSGQPIDPDTKVRFGIPNTISPGEVLINEILFDPISPGVDYVELYNHSNKTFDLSELKLGVVRESFPNPPDTVLKEITPDQRLFLPNSHILLSTDGYTVCQQYHCVPDDSFDMEAFPSYANSGGMALLMSRQGQVIDRMTFSEPMHYPLLKETKGVALERVSWEVPSDQSDNWHSAAEAVGFGTPGYRNSMMSSVLDSPSVNPIAVEPKVFSPDGDGFDDHCQLSYQFEEAGCTMNVYLFSADGQLVRHLVKGELVADEGSFLWNGLDTQGRRVPIGIYVVVTEVFDLKGVVRRYRNAVAVASR